MISTISFEATEKMDLVLELEQSNFGGKIMVWFGRCIVWYAD